MYERFENVILASMADIVVNNLIKSFQVGETVLNGLSFTVNPGERIGILGVNGSGKTTLFKILTGELDYDEGSVFVAPGKRLGLISQIPVYPEGYTTDDVLHSAFARLDAMSERMREIEEDFTADKMAEYDRLQSEFQRLGGYETESSINRVASGLDISSSMRGRLFESLSGGEKTRVNLARLILEDTDILLLDEPTNHLDLNAVIWLEDYISSFKGTVLAVSHDRYFLDKVAQRCIEITGGKAEFYSGNYSFFVEERQRRFDEKMKQYERDNAKVEQLTRAAEQMHLWAFLGMDKLHKRAFSMEKRIEKLKTSEKPVEARKLAVKFKEASFTGDEVLDCVNLSKSYGGKILLRDFSFEVLASESIAVIGNNGTGKSTLMQIITGEVPADCGIVRIGPQVKCAYLPQIVRFENESRTLLDTMLYEANCAPQQARDRLASFGFRGESVLKSVGTLSGGERSRLKLCILLGNDINLLILDEPTNHLDIASREWIESALSDYEQTLIFVSHDRYFIDKFATRVICFNGDGNITDYRGNYKEYLDFVSRLPAYEKTAKEKVRRERPKREAKANPSTLRKVESEIEKLESKIALLEQESSENCSDYLKLMEIEEEKSRLGQQLDELYLRWEELSE